MNNSVPFDRELKLLHPLKETTLLFRTITRKIFRYYLKTNSWKAEIRGRGRPRGRRAPLAPQTNAVASKLRLKRAPYFIIAYNIIQIIDLTQINSFLMVLCRIEAQMALNSSGVKRSASSESQETQALQLYSGLDSISDILTLLSI